MTPKSYSPVDKREKQKVRRMKSTLKVADISITVEADCSKGINRKFNYFIEKHTMEEMKLVYRREADIKVPGDLIAFDDSLKWAPSGERETTELYLFNRISHQPTYKLSADEDWKQIEVSYSPEEKKPIKSFSGTLGEIAFRNRLLHQKGIVIHGAAITCESKGIIFSGPSGMGKTTQANLWRRYKRAEIINHDRPAVRLLEGKAKVYGTLWNGSNSKYTNKSAPLTAVVILEQAKENTVTPLKGEEALKKLIPRCFLPYNNSRDMELALKNLEQILSVTPVYLLECRPDREAVELLYQWLR